MGLVTGGLNGRRYRVRTDLPEDFRTAWLDQIREHAFEAAPDASDPEPRIGWVDIFEPSNAEFELNTFLFDRYATLTARIDKKKVSSRYAKIALAERIRALCEERDVEKLDRAETEMVKEVLESELLRRSLPSVTTCDVAWDTQTGEVIVFSTSDSVIELVEALFKDTFGLSMHPERICVWLADRYTWAQITELVDSWLPGARGSAGSGAILDGWREDDPLEGALMPLAADFLTWLWQRSEISDGRIRLLDATEAQAAIVDRLVPAEPEAITDWNEVTETLRNAHLTVWLESRLKLMDLREEEMNETTILLGEVPSATPAARLGLGSGKRPVEARMGLRLSEDIDCGVTLSATPIGLAVSGLKIPFEVKKGQEAKIFERMAMLDLVHTTLRQLFQQFFLTRTSPQWEGRVDRWLAEDLAAK